MAETVRHRFDTTRRAGTSPKFESNYWGLASETRSAQSDMQGTKSILHDASSPQEDMERSQHGGIQNR